MSSDTHQILCGRCKVPLQGPTEAEDEDVFSCPSCGESDTRTEVLRVTAQYIQEVTARALQEKLRKSLRGNKFIKATGKAIPRRSHKYITGFIEKA